MTINYLQTADFLVFITESAFRKLIRDNDGKIGDAQSIACGYIQEKLGGRYLVTNELALQSDSRNPGMVRWMTILTVYYLYLSAPDDNLPNRIRDSYREVIREIDRVAAGKSHCTLSPVLDSAGKPKTAFCWASAPRRSHNPFEQ